MFAKYDDANSGSVAIESFRSLLLLDMPQNFTIALKVARIKKLVDSVVCNGIVNVAAATKLREYDVVHHCAINMLHCVFHVK